MPTDADNVHSVLPLMAGPRLPILPTGMVILTQLKQRGLLKVDYGSQTNLRIFYNVACTYIQHKISQCMYLNMIQVRWGNGHAMLTDPLLFLLNKIHFAPWELLPLDLDYAVNLLKVALYSTFMKYLSRHCTTKYTFEFMNYKQCCLFPCTTLFLWKFCSSR